MIYDFCLLRLNLILQIIFNEKISFFRFNNFLYRYFKYCESIRGVYYRKSEHLGVIIFHNNN